MMNLICVVFFFFLGFDGVAIVVSGFVMNIMNKLMNFVFFEQVNVAALGI